ncbi:unnamed protein product [Mucor circinelloides]
MRSSGMALSFLNRFLRDTYRLQIFTYNFFALWRRFTFYYNDSPLVAAQTLFFLLVYPNKPYKQRKKLVNYSGYQELKDFVENNEKPTFSRFANQYKDDIVRWSTQLSFQTASALYGIWYERFRQVVNAMPQPKK